MAEEKIAILQGELSKEGTHMFDKVELLKNEIIEWKKENHLMADVIRRNNQALTSMQGELEATNKDRKRLANELLYARDAANQFEKQSQSMARHLSTNRELDQPIRPYNPATGPASDDQDMMYQSSGLGAQSGSEENPGSGTRPIVKGKGRRFVGFTGDWEHYKKKNSDMLRDVGSLSEFYEGLLKLGAMHPNAVRRALAGGVGTAIGQVHRGSFIDETPDELEGDQDGSTQKDQTTADGFKGRVWGIPSKKVEEDEPEEEEQEQDPESSAKRTQNTQGVEGEEEDEEMEGEEGEDGVSQQTGRSAGTIVIPLVLPRDYSGGEVLPPMRRTTNMTFIELAKRWRASEKDDITKSKLLQCVQEQQSLKEEAQLPEYYHDFLIILKDALRSERPAIYQIGARILADLASSRKLVKKEFLAIEPIGAIARCLIPAAVREDPESLAARNTAAFDLIVFMDDVKLPWTAEMSQLVLEKNGLTTVLKTLQTKNEWQIVQVARIIAYMISNKQLIKEIRDLNGMSLLILNLESTNRTIRMNVVKSLAIMMNDIETRERYLAKKDNKLDEILSKIIDNEPDFMKYLLDILAHLMKNSDFASLLIDDADEFEQLLAILEDIESADCKNGVYKILIVLATDVDNKAKIYNAVHKIFIKQLSGLPKDYANNLLTTIESVISAQTKLPMDQELVQAIAVYLKKPDQLTKTAIGIVVRIFKAYITKYGVPFQEWVCNAGVQEALFSVYLSPIRDSNMAIIMNGLFGLFLIDKTLINPFLSSSAPLLVKSMLEQLRKRDENVRNSSTYNLQFILEDTLTHRYINLPDLRKIIELLSLKTEKAYNKDAPIVLTENKLKCVTYVFCMLSHLTTREEFMDTFSKLDLPVTTLEVLETNQLSAKTICDALSVLQNIFASIYGKKIIKKIYQLPGNWGMERISALSLPPVETNEVAQHTSPIWGCLAEELNSETLNILKNVSTKMFENLLLVASNAEAIGSLKGAVTNYLTQCEEVQALSDKIYEAKNILKKANPNIGNLSIAATPTAGSIPNTAKSGPNTGKNSKKGGK